MKDVERAKNAMAASIKDSKPRDEDFLSTGLTLLNLANYNRPFGGLRKGYIYRTIGKSQSAKSFLCRTILAEAANNPNFAKYQLIHDDVERGVLMDNVKFFGQKLANRISAPRYDKQKNPIYSSTIMDFYDEMNKKLNTGESVVWILDSQDALKNDVTSKVGDGKAKIHADQMRKLIDGMNRTGSILILVHHSKVNMMTMWGGDYTTGGASPEYYSTLDIRLSKLKKITKTIGERKYPIGNWVLAHVTKNRLTGMDRTIRFPIYTSYGIDDLGSCIEWLIEAGHWTKEKNLITAEEMDYSGPVSKLVQHIENTNQQRELQILTGRVWQKIEDTCALKRKPRYS